MKKMIYLLMGGLLVSATSFGQAAKNVGFEKKGATTIATKATVEAVAKDFDAPFWESDFSNPDDWDIGNETSDENDWVIGTEVPSGPFPIDGIASTTAANGYALYDSDLYCAGEDNAWIATANPIDLTNEPVVAVQFETYYRAYTGSCYIETSVDGNNWGNTIQILDVGTNNSTENPITVTQTISGIGNSPTAYIRLRYEGACDYSWMVDDFKVGTPPDNDLTFHAAYYDEYIEYLELEDFLDVDYIQQIEQSRYMDTQVRPLSFIVDVENIGTVEQTGVVASVSVTTPDGVEDFASEPVSIPSGERVFISIPDITLDAFDGGGSLGDYTINYSISQDQVDDNPSNNIDLMKGFSVVSDYMGSDEGDDWSVYYSTLGDDVIWGSRMMFEAEQQINSIQFGVLQIEEASSSPGDILFLNMRAGSVLEAVSEDNVMERFFGDTELEYTIGENDFTTSDETVWITYIFPDDTEITASPGVVYQGEVEVPVVGEDYLWLPFSDGQSELTGVLFEFEDQSDGPQGWFTIGDNNPHIRLGYNTSVGVEGPSMLNFKMDQNFPNPVMGSTTIKWELLEPAENVNFYITDVNGKTVYNEDLGSRSAGVQEFIELDLNLAPGNYQYALQIDNHRIVRKMIIVE